MRIARIARWALVILVALPLGIANARPQQSAASASNQGASQQEDPLVVAARRARQEKKTQTPTVWTNDNIPKQGVISVVGNTSESAPAPDSTNAALAAVGAPNQAATAGNSSDKGAGQSTGATSATTATASDGGGGANAGSNKAAADTSALQGDLDEAKQQLESLKTDLDILQRKYALDQQMY